MRFQLLQSYAHDFSRSRTNGNRRLAPLALCLLQDGEVESGTLTYQELDQQAQNIAAYLGQRVNVGDCALLLYPSGLEFIAAFMGCLYAGVVAVPAYPTDVTKTCHKSGTARPQQTTDR